MVSRSKQKWICKRKETYSKKEAEEISIMRNAKRGRAGYPYLCSECGWWHLTRGK